MRSFMSFICILIVITIFTACKDNTFDKEKDIEAINEIFNSYLLYLKNDDLDGFMMVWDDDAKRIGPDIPTIEGKENIREFFKNIFESVTSKMIPIGDLEVDVCKNMAYCYYHVSLVMTPRNGDPVQNTDIKGLSILRRKEDGSWKVYMDCMNHHPTLAVDSIDSLLLKDPSKYY